MHKAWCSIEVPYGFFFMSFIKFKGHMGWKIDDLNPIWVRLLSWSQLSNPSDLPCSFFLFLVICSIGSGTSSLIQWHHLWENVRIIIASRISCTLSGIDVSPSCSTLLAICQKTMQGICVFSYTYRQTSNISRTLVGNKIVDNSDVVEASPVGAAPTTSSFST